MRSLSMDSSFENYETWTYDDEDVRGPTIRVSPKVLKVIVKDYEPKICDYELQPMDESMFENEEEDDDFSCFVDIKTIPNYEKTTEKVWKHLGLVPKYIIIGEYEDITFCSTNVIHMNKHTGNDQFKIIRRVDRLTPLSHWCTKALQYSNAEMQQYYKDLALSMRCWASDMPFFQEYIDAMEHHAKSLVVTNKSKLPETKKRMYFDTTNNGPLRGFLDLSHYDKYDRDFIHGYELRQSSLRPTKQETLDFFENKYNIKSLSLIDFGRQLKSTLWVDPYIS